MFGWLLRKFLPNKLSIVIQNIQHSKVNVAVLFFKPFFTVRESWLKKLYDITYDDEIKSKFVPELHQDHDFERKELQDVLQFKNWIGRGLKSIEASLLAINDFDKTYKGFYNILQAEQITVKTPTDSLIIYTEKLHSATQHLSQSLNDLKKIFNSEGYKVLGKKNEIKDIVLPTPDRLKRNRSNWNQVLDKSPQDHFLLLSLSSAHDNVYENLASLNRWLEEFRLKSNYKIISGKAGTGKTHTSAFLVKEINANGDYVVFFKAKQFSGDNVSFEERLLELMQLPHGYRLEELFNKLNKFSTKRNKRFYFIVDALNETTTSSLGFSPIWQQSVQRFINLISQYPNLFLIITLRISYVESIWEHRPKRIAELRGFSNYKDIIAVCEKYFKYYKINIINTKADLNYFTVPLLLDLFCKMTNETRTESVNISLGIDSYISIFEGYVAALVSEVQRKRNLSMSTLILDGL